jgi:hypothetical protein
VWQQGKIDEKVVYVRQGDRQDGKRGTQGEVEDKPPGRGREEGTFGVRGGSQKHRSQHPRDLELGDSIGCCRPFPLLTLRKPDMGKANLSSFSLVLVS